MNVDSLMVNRGPGRECGEIYGKQSAWRMHEFTDVAETILKIWEHRESLAATVKRIRTNLTR